MIHILQKIADWIVEHEASDAEQCSVPDEIIDEWEATVDEEMRYLEEKKETDSERYAMLKDLHERIEQIREIRKKRCHI